MTDAAERLRALAKRLVALEVEHAEPAAALLTGSVSTGEADEYSDIDLILYFGGAIPDDEAIDAVRNAVGGGDATAIGPRTEVAYAIQFPVDGVQVQLAHETLASAEADIAKVVEELEVDTPLQKALEGLHLGTPLHGAETIERLRARAAYSEDLQRAMIETFWRFYPLWYVADQLERRDAVVWRYEVMAQSAYNVLGVLAGLNRVWFTTFQLKRMRKLVESFELAPPELADRLEALFDPDAKRAVAELERLVGETRELVRQRFPDLELPLTRELGTRHAPFG
ncbi:MAG TPA: nucleotidyltransferase domain-containing protein [Gaiellaceae bacterium]